MEYTKSLRRAFSLRSRSSKYSPDLEIRSKDKGQNKVKMKSQDQPSIPMPMKVTELPTLSQSSPKKESNEESTYDVPWDGPCIQGFVILPKSRKTRLARLATYRVCLCKKLTMFFKPKEEYQELNMDSDRLTDFVTMSGLDMTDFSGWMYDLDPDSGQRSWCVLADMLLCVFSNECEENPRKVIMLPGQEVKAVVFNSVKHDAVPNHSGSNTEHNSADRNKTISGMLKYQIILMDPCSGVKHIFALDKQEDVDRWVTLLRVAVSLDSEIFIESDEDEDDLLSEINKTLLNGNTEPIAIPGSNEDEIDGNGLNEEGVPPSPKSPTKSKIPKLSATKTAPGQKETATAKKPKYVPTSIEIDQNQRNKAPLSDANGNHSDTTYVKYEVRSNSPVFSRVKRAESLSAVSCMSEKSIDPCKTELTSSNSSLDRSKRPSASSLISAPGSPLMGLIRRYRGRSASSSSAETASQETTGEYRQRTNSTSSCSSTSTEGSDKKGSGIGAKIIRKASTFKVKMFGSKGKGMEEEPVYLGSLTNVKISGYLGVKYLLKWNEFWCLVSQGYLYCFNTQSPSDTPELTLLLRECSVHFLTDNRSKKYTFKLCQGSARSVHFAAKDNSELSKWILALRREIKAWDDTQTHAKPPTNVNLNRYSLGSHLSLDSSASVQSHASLASQNSLTSQNSTGSGSSSLSSLSHNSNENDILNKVLSKYENQNNPRLMMQANVPMDNNHTRSNTSSKAGGIQHHKEPIIKGVHNLPEQNGAHKSKKIALSKSLDSPMWQTPCSAHGLETGPPYQWTEHYQRSSSSFKGSQSSSDSFGCPTTPDSEGPDAVFASSADSNQLTSSLRNVTVSLSAKYSSSPKYDLNLHQVWKNDKSYQLQMLKAKVSALPDKPAIFNRHLPGPYNEGLLMVSDSGTEAPPSRSTVNDPGGASHDQSGGTGDEDDESSITRSPSMKLGRKFSLKRQRSIKDYHPGTYLQRRNSKKKIAELTKAALQSDRTQAKWDDTLEQRQKKQTEAEDKMPMSDKGLPENFDANTRRRSLSDGQLPVTLQQFREGYDPQNPNQVKERPKVEVTIPARELNNPTLAGYLERKDGEEWISCWCVLKDNTLYTYAAPIDDVTQDVLQLPGYQVQPCLPTPEKYLFQLVHPEYPPITMSAESSNDTETWMERLHLATQKLTLDSLNLDMSNSMQYDKRTVTREELEEEARRQWQRELLKLKKQQLLREVLQQKEELTKKQHKFAKSKQSSLEDSNQDEKEAADQMLRERALLKQRKVSTQLKLEMTQKQLQTSLTRTKTKKKGFKLPGMKSDKPVVTTVSLPGMSHDVDYLESQIKELSSEIDTINWEVDQIDRKTASLGGHAPQRRKTFAVNSIGSSERSSSRDRSRSDLSVMKGGRGYPSEPNLLNAGHMQQEQQDHAHKFDTHLRPDNFTSDAKMDGNTKVQLMSYSKLSSNSDIPMIDDSPPITRVSKGQEASVRSLTYRQSIDNESIPVFSLDTPSPIDDPYSNNIGLEGGLRASGLNKSCDLSEIQGFSRESRNRHMDLSERSSTSLRVVSRTKSESTNLKKTKISASALAEIAAFEELVQQKMKVTTPPSSDFSLSYR